MKKETSRVKEYRAERIKENKAYNFSVLINDKELAEFAKKNIPNKSEFIKQAIKNFMHKKMA
ncbi:MAG: hypothetical protein RLZZ210_1329 [Pseudomonadota bacterium]|jgi:hypothetical protein